MNTSSPVILPWIEKAIEQPVPEVLQSWHDELQRARGARAELRRAASPAEVLLCPGFRSLRRHFRPWLGQCEWRWLGLAVIAGVASHIKRVSLKASFAAQLGDSSGSGKPRLSSLRFARLQQAHDVEELYRLLLRAVSQLEGEVNLPSLADDILLWCREHLDAQYGLTTEPNPFRRLSLRWATEYFQATEMTEE